MAKYSICLPIVLGNQCFYTTRGDNSKEKGRAERMNNSHLFAQVQPPYQVILAKNLRENHHFWCEPAQKGTEPSAIFRCSAVRAIDGERRGERFFLSSNHLPPPLCAPPTRAMKVKAAAPSAPAPPPVQETPANAPAQSTTQITTHDASPPSPSPSSSPSSPEEPLAGFSDEYLQTMNAVLAQQPLGAVLEWCFTSLPAFFQVTSFGSAGMVIIHELAKLNLQVPPLFLSLLSVPYTHTSLTLCSAEISSKIKCLFLVFCFFSASYFIFL